MARVEVQFGLVQPRQKAEDIVRLDAVTGVGESEFRPVGPLDDDLGT